MTAPTSKAGVSRFLADYQSNTWHRVMVEIRPGKYEPHPTLPLFEFRALAEIEAAKLAGPTRVDAERSGNGSIEGGIFGTPQGVSADPSDRNRGVGCPSDLDCQPVLFCQCGHPEDEHYMGSVCQKIEGMYVCGCEHFVGEAAA